MTTGRCLLAVMGMLPVADIGLEAACRVWRRCLLPAERDQLSPRVYRRLLRLARSVDYATARELADALAWVRR